MYNVQGETNDFLRNDIAPERIKFVPAHEVTKLK